MWVPERDGNLPKGCTALLRKPHRGPVFVSLSRCLIEYKTGSGPFRVGLVISLLGAADWWVNVLRSFVIWDGLDQGPQPGWVGHAGSLGHGWMSRRFWEMGTSRGSGEAGANTGHKSALLELVHTGSLCPPLPTVAFSTAP